MQRCVLEERRDSSSRKFGNHCYKLNKQAMAILKKKFDHGRELMDVLFFFFLTETAKGSLNMQRLTMRLHVCSMLMLSRT